MVSTIRAASPVSGLYQAGLPRDWVKAFILDAPRKGCRPAQSGQTLDEDARDGSTPVQSHLTRYYMSCAVKVANEYGQRCHGPPGTRAPDGLANDAMAARAYPCWGQSSPCLKAGG